MLQNPNNPISTTTPRVYARTLLIFSVSFMKGPPEVGVGDGATELVLETLPSSVLCIAQIFLIPSTTAGRFFVFRTSSWPVWMKLPKGVTTTVTKRFRRIVPINALRKRCLKSIHTCTLDNIDERGRVVYDLVICESVVIRVISEGPWTNHREIGQDWCSLCTWVDTWIVLNGFGNVSIRDSGGR